MDSFIAFFVVVVVDIIFNLLLGASFIYSLAHGMFLSTFFYIMWYISNRGARNE